MAVVIGAEGLNVQNVTYGDPVSTGHKRPNAIYRKFTWSDLAVSTSGVYPSTDHFTIDLFTVAQKLSAVQSIWVDNSRCASSIEIAVTFTHYRLSIRAFSQGLYPLVTNPNATLTFKVLDNISLIGVLGETQVLLFDRAHTPFYVPPPDLSSAFTVNYPANANNNALINLSGGATPAPFFQSYTQDGFAITRITITPTEFWTAQGSAQIPFVIQSRGTIVGGLITTFDILRFTYFASSASEPLNSVIVKPALTFDFKNPLLVPMILGNGSYPSLTINYDPYYSQFPAALAIEMSFQVSSVGISVTPSRT